MSSSQQWHYTSLVHEIKISIYEISELECGPMPNMMVALPHIGGALCSTPQNATKTRKPLNLLGCPKLQNLSQPIVGRKFTILWGHVDDILLLNKFFPIADTCLSCEDSARQSCAMVPRWRFLCHFCILYFQRAACSTFQTCNSKFALRPHHV